MQSLHNLSSKTKVVSLIVVGSKHLLRFLLATLHCPLHRENRIDVAVVVVIMVAVVVVVVCCCCNAFVKTVNDPF